MKNIFLKFEVFVEKKGIVNRRKIVMNVCIFSVI